MQFIDRSVKIGCHINKNGTIYDSVYKHACGVMSCAQIFISSPRGFNVPPIDKKDSEKTLSFLECSVFNVYVHACLLYNLNGMTKFDTIDEHIAKAKTSKILEKLLEEKKKIPTSIERVVGLLSTELNLCKNTFGTGVVVHIGSGENKEKAIVRISNTINQVFEQTEDGVFLMLENAAGEGNKIGSDINEIFEIIENVEKKSQIGICIDTCHLFAAGVWDISKPEIVQKFFKWFEEKRGSPPDLIHLNDSMGEFGCKKDRHATLGEGYIFKNKQALKCIVDYCNENKIDMILETPKEHDEEIEMIFKMST